MTFREKIYTLREEIIEGEPRYFISFKDGQDEPHEVEVSHAVYCEFIAFRKINRNLEGFNERHNESNVPYLEIAYDREMNGSVEVGEVGCQERAVSMGR